MVCVVLIKSVPKKAHKYLYNYFNNILWVKIVFQSTRSLQTVCRFMVIPIWNAVQLWIVKAFWKSNHILTSLCNLMILFLHPYVQNARNFIASIVWTLIILANLVKVKLTKNIRNGLNQTRQLSESAKIVISELKRKVVVLTWYAKCVNMSGAGYVNKISQCTRPNVQIIRLI